MLLELAVTALAFAPQGPDLTPRFDVPDDLRVTRFAESPQLFNPTAIDVDATGRVWVAEGVNYRKWNGRNAGREHPDGERIVILEDRDGDGVADTSKVFVEDPDLLVPLGIAVIGDAVYVSCSPALYVYRDTDGDDVADARETLLDGFGGRDHDHGLHSVVLGPDGALWFNCGNAGPHVVADRDGFTLRSGSIYAGGGSTAAPNRSGLVSDDGRVWTMGLVLRVGRDGGGLTPIAHNFRNPYEVALDSFGDAFQSDNDDDGNQCCRTLWVLPGGNHGYGSPDGSRTWRADRRPGQDVWDAHWHQGDPGVAPAGCRNGAGGPTGVAVYEGGLLPERFVGAVLNADAGAGVVYAHRPRSDGAGFALEPDVLIRPEQGAAGGERARWFRPSDVCVGPDGSVYVADWYDPGVGGHGAGDREAYGRILRIAPAGADPRVRASAFADPLAALDCPAVNVRARAHDWIVAADEAEVTARLRAAWSGADVRARARLLWLMARHAPTRDEVRDVAADAAADQRLRVTAFRALVAAGVEPVALVGAMLEESTPALDRESALVLRDVPAARALPLLVTLARRHRPGDRTGLEALGIGAEGKEEELFAALLAAHEGGATEWPPWFAEVAWRLHPRSAVPAFLIRALAPSLTSEQRGEMVTALAFVPTRAAADAMAAIAVGGPEDVQGIALWWLRQNAGSTWAGFDTAVGAEVDPERAVTRWQSEVLGTDSAAVPIDVSLGGGYGERTLWLIVDDGGDGFSHDWASWCDLRLVGPAGALRVDQLPFVIGETGWGELRVGRNAGGGPLVIAGQEFATGIGAHAPSKIAVRVPTGYDRLVGTVGADDGGTGQQGAQTSLRFVVRSTEPPDRAAFEAARSTLLDADASPAARRGAAEELALDPEGGLLLVRMAKERRLGDALIAAVAARIFRNPDVAVRALASEEFPRPGAAAKFPSIPELVAMDGDATRGRAVFFGDRAACSTCHVHGGEGRDLGPELTAIGAKYDATGVIDAILNPNAGIAFGYETWLIERKDGTAHFGFLLADGPRLVVKDAAGQRHVIDADDVVRRQLQKVSLMPDSVALALQAQDIADLAAFLAPR